MSSLESSAASDENAAIGAAFAYVVEHSFFAFAEACPCTFSDAAWEGPLLRIAVRFAGAAQGGTVEMLLPEPLAVELGASFCGCESVELTPAMVRDAAGELCNIVGGLWLTRGFPMEHFSLAPPQVGRPGVDPLRGTWFHLRINDAPASVRVVHSGGAA